MKIYNSIILLFSILLISSCLGTAKITDFPISSEEIDFNKYETEENSDSTPSWTFQTSSEYYIEVDKSLEESYLTEVLKKHLRFEGYEIQVSDLSSQKIIGKRGLRAHEWNSMIAIYYKITDGKTQIYLKNLITQDATGGPNINRASEVGFLIESELKNKK